MITASIVGASGYGGGELLRLLLAHPEVEVKQVTSERLAKKFVHLTHPNLRGATKLKFCSTSELEPVDMLFLAMPHGKSADQIEHWASIGTKIIDLAADFRLNDPEIYKEWYGEEHPNPEWLSKFVYGLPEVNREQIKGADYVSGVGCNATATNLALMPLAKAGLIDKVVIEVKVGSSEGGNKHSSASHHPVRVNAVRSFAPTGHRHQAEVLQALGDFEMHFSGTAIELVRGILCTAHIFTKEPISEKDVWKLYRATYKEEPFVRIVKERRGDYRYPEPKILAGTNFADVGFAVDEKSNRVVAISAIDNLMKGASGTAVQCMNLMWGFPETQGLEFYGLHPI